MTVSPVFGFWVSLLAVVIGALIGGGAQFTDLFGPEEARRILAWLALGNIVVSAVNMAINSPRGAPRVAKLLRLKLKKGKQ